MRSAVPVRMFWKASSTLLASKADVSIKERLFSPGRTTVSSSSMFPRHAMHYVLANCLASSVGTARRCLKSLLFPTNMMTMLESAWSRSSFSHRSTFSKVTAHTMTGTLAAGAHPRCQCCRHAALQCHAGLGHAARPITVA